MGRELYLQCFATFVGAQCDLVLLSRNMTGMDETMSLITSTAPGISVHLVQGDLSKLDTIDGVFAKAIKPADQDKHQQFVLLHNSGSQGDVTKPIVEHSDPQLVQDYLALNFTSMYVLTARFLTRFKSGHRMVINISSRLSTHSLPSFSWYSSAKSARNAFMGVLAAENPDVRVLSFCPGLLYSEMQQSVLKECFSDETSALIKKLTKCSKTTQNAIAEFIEILKKDDFKNGAFVSVKLNGE